MVAKYELDFTLLSRELKLLLELIKTDNDEHIKLKQDEWFKDINWDSFLQLVKHHRVYPLIYMKLKDIDKGSIPENMMQILYGEYRKNTLQMLQLSGEMEKISRIFIENQIQLLFLKGPVLAYDLYGDISLRTCRDLDILVPRKDIEKAENLLLDLGYINEEGPILLNERKWKNHHTEYSHPKKGIQVEIHWRLHMPPMKEPTFNELWKRKRSITFTNYPIFFLGEEDLFLHLVVHGARHAWFRIRWLKDIDQIVKKGMDLKKVNLLIRKYKYRNMVGQTYILAAQLLNSPIHGGMEVLTNKKNAESLAKKAYLYITSSKKFSYDTRYLFSLNSTLRKFLYLIILFYPNSLDMKTLKLPKAFHFLYFLLRPFLWIKRQKEKNLEK